MDEDVGVLELGDHLLGVGDEIGREIAAVELHALDHVELGHGGFGFFDRDHAFLADLVLGVIILPIVLSPLAEIEPT